jgi:hypothetical protein
VRRLRFTPPVSSTSALCGVALAFLFLALTAPSAQAACPNEALRLEDNSLNLPDCRAYELVSPADKNGGAIQGFNGISGGSVLQAAANGEAATFGSSASFGAGAQGAPAASQYIARRSPGGWSTENITTPSVSGSYGDEPNGVPYQLFSTDLARGLLLNGVHCRGDQMGGCPVANPPLPGSAAPLGYQNYYLRDEEGGGFQALITHADAPELKLSAEAFSVSLAGATPDLRHVALSTCAKLTSNATEVPGCDSGGPNLYEWSEGALRLLNLLPGETHGTPDAHLAAPAGAISANGSRVYFSEGEDAFLYLREGEGTQWVDELVGGGGTFQAASADGSVAFYTKAEKLYRYQAQPKTSELLAEGVKGVLGASEDGSYVYYLAVTGLFLEHNGTITKVAAAADSSDYPPATGAARVSPDGAHLAFLSKASLTGYGNTDANTHEPDSEVFLYNAASKELTCASCRPSGKAPLGPSTIPGAIANGVGEAATQAYKPRDLSANGGRLFFNSRDVLAAKDANTHQDVYQWEAKGSGSCLQASGCISLISGGQGGLDAEFIDASPDGHDAFFLTDSSLVLQDPGSQDLYDAREEGGYPAPPTPIECGGDTCQPLPPEPEDPTPGTAGPGATPNPPVSFPKTHKKKHHKRHHKRVASHHRRGGKR